MIIRRDCVWCVADENAECEAFGVGTFVGSMLDGFDLVVDPLQRTGGDLLVVSGHQSGAVRTRRLRHRHQYLDGGGLGLIEPGVQPFVRRWLRALWPE